MNARATALMPAGLLLALVMTKLVGPSAADEPKKQSLSDPRVHSVVKLDHDDLTESSGLAVSNRQQNRFWTHNDSAGKARLFAFDQQGKLTGQCQLRGASSDDWEDLASFVQDDRARLLIADSGDNRAERNSISLYLLDEPNPDQSTQVDAYHELKVTYSDGPCDCEAVAVDPIRNEIVLIAKRALPNGGIYTLPLPASTFGRVSKKKVRTQENVTATRIGTMPIALISSMDLHGESGDIWVVNFFTAYHYPCERRDEPFQQQLARPGRQHPLPRWKQIEAVAIDPSADVWITHEGKPAHLARLRIPDAPSRKTTP